jgi:hypothetical protein
MLLNREGAKDAKEHREERRRFLKSMPFFAPSRFKNKEKRRGV